MRVSVAAALIALACASASRADGPAYLVKNVNQTIDWRGSSFPHDFADVEQVYFLANQGEFVPGQWYGTDALWRTDSTPDGTVALRDAGVDIGRPYRMASFDAIVAQGSQAISAQSSSGCQTGAGDGRGAALLLAALPVLWRRRRSRPVHREARQRYGMRWHALLAALAVIAAWAPSRSRADGPAYLVKNINRTVDRHSSSNPHDVAEVGEWIYFLANEGEYTGQARMPDAVWRTDGSAAGTAALHDLGVDVGRPSHILSFGDVLIVASESGLWRTDGTPAGTSLLGAGLASEMVAAGGSLFLVMDETLLVSDGSPQGTHRVSAPEDLYMPRHLVAFGDGILFTGCEATHGCELWHSDGTAAGTGMVADLFPGISDGLNDQDGEFHSAILDGVLYFRAQSPEAGSELWRSDGTPAGTRRVTDLNPGPGNSLYDWDFAGFAVAADQLFFIASEPQHGAELWRTDGSAAGTALVADLVPGVDGIFGNCPAQLTPVVGEGLYFITCGGVEPFVLWHTDGSAAGTRIVESDVGPALSSFGGDLYSARWNDHGSLDFLRRASSSATPTHLASGFTDVTAIFTTSRGVLFDGSTAAVGNEPWWSDGTAAGTYLLHDIRGDDAGSSPDELTALGATAIFTADDGVHGRELWRSDGSDDGTALIADIAAGVAASAPTQLIQLGDGVLFTADDGAHGRELWRTNASAAGTTLLADIMAGTASSAPDRFAMVDGLLLFYADDGVHGRELWRSDGTASGTALVADIQSGPGSSNPAIDCCADQVVWKGALYFTADDGVSGRGLWRSDGTMAGTHRVIDLAPGAASSNIERMVGAPSGLYFAALDDALWRSDGTEAGTVLVDASDRYFYQASVAGDALYASAYDDYVESVWQLDAGGGPQIVAVDTELLPLFAVGDQLFGLTQFGDVWRLHYGPIPTVQYVDRFTGVHVIDRRIVLYDDLEHSLWTLRADAANSYPVQTLPAAERRDSVDEDPSGFVRVGHKIFFSAATSDIGSELWAIPVDALPEICGDTCESVETPSPSASPTPTATRAPTTATAIQSSSGCQTGGGSDGGAWALVAATPLLLRRRRRSPARVTILRLRVR